jgi:DNA polymerase-3 subunit gamma/tau
VKVADDKPYQSLYRKYRPQGPAEVLGQDHVIRALSGAVREGRLAHAFLLCGPRGTGKTSTARILAKMVNCEQGPTPEPCGVCDQCVAIREGQHLDVVEIDAASHGGVDDARDLREKAPTAPVQGREKVYIIDEAQRLSREAFDALLRCSRSPRPASGSSLRPPSRTRCRLRSSAAASASTSGACRSRRWPSTSSAWLRTRG